VITPEEAQKIYDRLSALNLKLNFYEFGSGSMDIEDSRGIVYQIESVEQFETLVA
jgi:hypothetical protein